MQPRRHFSQATLDWFEQGDTMATRTDLAPYEPFQRTPLRVRVATVAASLAALAGAAWLVT